MPEEVVLVFYPPEGLGDNSYMDTFCYGVHKTALSHAVFQYDVCPEDWKQAGILLYFYIAALSSDADVENSPVLCIFADSGYLSLLADFADDVPENITFLLFESKETELSYVHTAYLPLYGASYLAGIASKELLLTTELPSGNKSPRVLAVLANSSLPLLTEAAYSFYEGFGSLWDGGIYDVDEDFSSLEYTAIRLSAGGEDASDPSGFNSASLLYTVVRSLQSTSPYDMYFPLCGGSVHGLLRYSREKGGDTFFTLGMDSDLSVYSAMVPFSVVKHIDRAVQYCIEQWLTEGNLPHHLQFDLAGGYTGLVFAPGYEAALSETVQKALPTAIEKEREHEKTQ